MCFSENIYYILISILLREGVKIGLLCRQKGSIFGWNWLTLTSAFSLCFLLPHLIWHISSLISLMWIKNVKKVTSCFNHPLNNHYFYNSQMPNFRMLLMNQMKLTCKMILRMRASKVKLPLQQGKVRRNCKVMKNLRSQVVQVVQVVQKII